MGDDYGQPRTFGEALAAVFGERASDFSEELAGRLHRLYERGRQDGRRESYHSVSEAHHRADRTMEAARAMAEAPYETRDHAERALRAMLEQTMLDAELLKEGA